MILVYHSLYVTTVAVIGLPTFLIMVVAVLKQRYLFVAKLYLPASVHCYAQNALLTFVICITHMKSFLNYDTYS